MNIAHKDAASFLAAIGCGLPDADGYIVTVTQAGSHFVAGFDPDATPGAFEGYKLRPTAVLYKEGGALNFWALEKPVPESDPDLLGVADALGMAGVDEPLPTPGVNGWSLTHHDANARYPLSVLTAAYVASAEGEPTEGPGGEAEVASAESAPAAEVLGDHMAPKTYGDALIVTAYNEAEYANEIIITTGGKRDSKQWKPLTMPAGAFIALLCRHKEGSKDGQAFVLGDMVPGQRLKTSVKALYGVGLDIDTGTPTAVVDAALRKLGCLAVRYSTHSSDKTKTEIKRDKVVRYAGDRDIGEVLMREFLREVEQWDPTMVDHAEYIGTDHTEKGIVCQITHPPMPKHRIVLLFKEPFDIGKEGTSQAEAMKNWAKVPEALAHMLAVPFDTSCTDPSRLFYLPRHAKGKPFSISLFGGPYFDWRTLELENPMDKLASAISRGKSKSVTDEGRELGRWHLKRGHGFQIADVIDAHAPDRIRHNTGRGYEIECPFDEDHSNAGDQEDRACLVVNAGEGAGEFFTISCRHETCRDKTMLDMLGKMVKDGWFPKDVLEDEQFNAIIEDEDKPEVALKIEREDDARADYEAAIAALTPNYTQSDLDAAVALTIEANLPAAMLSRAEDEINKNTKLKIGVIRTTFAEIKRKMPTTATQTGPSHAPKGQRIFAYAGEYNFDEACDAVIQAVLAENARCRLPVLSAMDGVMVRMETDANGDVEFVPVFHLDFWAYALKFVLFVDRGENGDGLRQKVPEDVARACHGNCRDWLPEAPEVVDAPTFLGNGDLLFSSGYHYAPEHNLNHLLRLDRFPGEVKVPPEPSQEDAYAAVAYLKDEVLVDFPFLDMDMEGAERREPAEANALAMILTPFMRRMIEGCTPLFFIMKPDAGTGATLLSSVGPLLLDGTEPEQMRYTNNAEEMNKGIIAGIQKPRSHMVFDNVTDFNSPELLRALTAMYVSGRLLGTSKLVSRPNRYNWIGTGINPYVKVEMDRRICWVRMNAEGRSSDEYEFRHPNVSGYGFDQFLLTHRHIIVGHLLTMIQYWVNSGMPLFNKRRRASFENWSAKVGGVLELCGVEGFLDNKKYTARDREKVALTQIANRWFARHGTGEDNKISENHIFDLASNPPVAIINGHNEESRRSNFMDQLPIMIGKTFMFELTQGASQPFKVKCEADDNGDVFYWLEPIKKAKVVA